MSNSSPALSVAGGTIPEEGLYISRPEDDDVYELLLEGTYCNVLSSRQMGKSSLVARLKHKLQDQGIRLLRADLSSLGGKSLGSSSIRAGVAWHNALLKTIARDLCPPARVQAWLRARPEEPMGARVQAFVEDFLLEGDGRWVIVFDEVDVTRDLDFTDELFLAIRFLFNERAARPELKRVTFCMVGVFAADDLIKSDTSTPYNIGRTVRLLDFSRARCDMSKLEEYLDSHGLDGPKVLDEVLLWTSGQPFLTITLCDRAARGKKNSGVARFVRDELSNPTIFKVHFDRMELVVRERIVSSSKMRSRYLRMLWGLSVSPLQDRDETTFLLAGLVRVTRRGRLTTRNRIYRMRFDRRWVEAILPTPPVARSLRVLVTVLALLLLGGVGAVLLWWRHRAASDRESKQVALAIADASERIEKAESDDAAKNEWAIAKGRRILGGLQSPAQSYWKRRIDELNALAATLAAGGCAEEAYAVRAFASARASRTPVPWEPNVAETMWLPESPQTGSEVDQCHARRNVVCDNVTFVGSSLVAACGTSLVTFAVQVPPRPSAGAEISRAPLIAGDDEWSVGIAEGYTGALGVRHGSDVATTVVCPAQKTDWTGSVRPALREILVRSTSGRAHIAYLCADGTFAEQFISDVPSWFEGVRSGNRRVGQGGYGAGEIAWLGDHLVAGSLGPSGEIVFDHGLRLPLRGLSTIGSFDRGTPLVAYGTEWPGADSRETSALLGIAELDGDRPVVTGTWHLHDACASAGCVVRAVSGGTDRTVAGVVVGLDDKGHASGAWLAIVRSGELQEVRLDDLNPDDAKSVALGSWLGTAMAAVPLAGRVRLYTLDPPRDDSWTTVQQRLGLTVVFATTAHVVSLAGSPHQGVQRFEDIFPP